MAVKSKLAQELLVDGEHLRWTIKLLMAVDVADAEITRFREQLALVEELNMEVDAAMYIIDRDQLPEKALEDVTEIRDLAIDFLKKEDRNMGRNYINMLRKARRTFFSFAADKNASKVQAQGIDHGACALPESKK